LTNRFLCLPLFVDFMPIPKTLRKVAIIMVAAVLMGGHWQARAQIYSLNNAWTIANGTTGTHLATGDVNRSLAYSALSNLLYVVNNGVNGDGTTPAIDVFDGSSGSLVGNANITGVSGGTFLLNTVCVSDDGVVYSANLSSAVNSTPFNLYRWTNYLAAPTIAFSGNPAAGLSLPGLRMGDTMAIRGSGTSTLLLAPLENYVTPTTNVALFDSTDGIHFSSTIIGITGLPALTSGGGGTFGVSFYTNNTFLFKPSGPDVYIVQFPSNFASSSGTWVAGIVISTNPLTGGTVVLDCNASAGLTAALGTIPNAAPAMTPISLYAVPPVAGFAVAVATNSSPHTNSNGNFAGAVALGGAGKTNFIYSLDCNNGVCCWRTPYAGSGVETGIATPSELQTVLNTNTQGSVVSLDSIDPVSCPLISMSQTYSGGRLIFSDSPESPTNTGILYMDTNLAATAGSAPNRIFAYHVNNNSSEPMKFSVLIENNGSSNATLTVQRTGIAGPSANYAVVGETAFYRWLTNVTSTSITVAPGQIVRLDTNFDTIDVSQNDLLNGIWDYTFSQPHTIIICALNPLDNPITVGPTLSVLARDIHDRGTFANCNKAYDTSPGVLIDTAAGIRQFPLAGNGDTYVTGFDNAVSPPTAVTDSGNYGVVYTIQMNTSSSDGRALGLLISPQGGSWCGAVNADPGLLPGGAFILPPGGQMISSSSSAAIEGEYYPNGGKTIQFQFMPTGASSFPVCLLTVPFSSTAPDLAPINNYEINPGQTVSFTANATNGTGLLNFSLSLAPAGAIVGLTNGFFNWRSPVASAGTTQNVQLCVSESGPVLQSDTEAFEILVNPLGLVTFDSASFKDSVFQMQLSGT
jgi:hypothetical protein